MTFLSVYTPTFRRPGLLEACKASVRAQSVPVEHVIVEDLVGLGVAGMFKDIRNHVALVTGEYVMVLSDDNVLVDPLFAEELESVAGDAELPDVVVFKGRIATSVQPLLWDCEPEVGRIDLSCFAVRREVWAAHTKDWGARYEGDFDFIHALWDAGYRFHWWDRLVFEATRISRGASEDEFEVAA